MNKVPKYIWLWWEQGWENAPFICSYTIKSFTHFNPDYKLNLICKQNFNEYIDEKYNWLFQCQGAAFRADIVRLLLLQKYGGIYADAATFCCVNLTTFLKEINFNQFWGFDIKAFNKKQDERTLGSWFYISEPNTYIINTFTNTFLEKAKQSPIKHIYFLHHKTLSDLITNDTQFKHWYNNLKKINIFMNRISAKYLACESMTILNEPSWFHPQRIDEMIHNNEFKIIKLRHKGIATKDELLKENTIFRLIIDKYLK